VCLSRETVPLKLSDVIKLKAVLVTGAARNSIHYFAGTGANPKWSEPEPHLLLVLEPIMLLPNVNNVKCIASLRHGVGATSLTIPGYEPYQNDVVPVIPVLIKTMMCFSGMLFINSILFYSTGTVSFRPLVFFRQTVLLGPLIHGLKRRCI
jgi:hypothetical protein